MQCPLSKSSARLCKLSIHQDCLFASWTLSMFHVWQMKWTTIKRTRPPAKVPDISRIDWQNNGCIKCVRNLSCGREGVKSNCRVSAQLSNLWKALEAQFFCCPGPTCIGILCVTAEPGNFGFLFHKSYKPTLMCTSNCPRQDSKTFCPSLFRFWRLSLDWHHSNLGDARPTGSNSRC